MKKLEPPDERVGARRQDDLKGRLAGAVIDSLLGIRDRAGEGLAAIRSQPKWWFLIPLGVVLAWWAGSAVATGGTRQTWAISVAALALGVPTVRAILGGRIRAGFIVVEVPLLLLLLSTLVFRGRSADELAFNPLDPAAQFRVLCVALAMILAGLALISPPYAVPANGRVTSRPIRLYLLYVVVVFLGAPQSFSLALTGYRGIELLAGLMVVVGARHMVGDDAGDRIGAVLYWFTVGLLLSVWVTFLVAPDLVVIQMTNPNVPIPIQIQGFFPSLSANGVGTVGVLLTVWTLARLRTLSPQAHLQRMLGYALAGLGIASLVLAQYRTGYGALVAGLLVYLLLGRRWVLATIVLAIVIGVIMMGAAKLVDEAEPYVFRGQSPEQAATLSGRLDFWGAGIPVWEKSPLIGRGLLTGTRFEVLAPLGFTYTSGIHSTWVEALVGTGAIGLVLLSLSFLITYWRAFVRAFRTTDMVPVLLLTVIAVRSVTGNTFESLSHQTVVFLWLAITLSDESDRKDEIATSPTAGLP